MDRSYIPYIADAVCVIVLALFMRFYAKKGLYNCMAPFLVIILSLAFAIYGSNFLTKPVTDRYVFPAIEDRVTEELSDAFTSKDGAEELGSTDISLIDSEKLEEISDKVKEYAEKAGINTDKLDIEALLGRGDDGEKEGPGTAQTVKEKVQEGLLEQAYNATSAIVHWALFGVLVLIGLLVFNLLKRVVGLIADLPIIRFFDALGGIVIGAAVFTVFIFIASRLLRHFGVGFLDEAAEETYILSRFMAL